MKYYMIEIFITSLSLPKSIQLSIGNMNINVHIFHLTKEDGHFQGTTRKEGH